ncbi:sialate O-acetylesterase [Salipiger abyssi]|uniref:sialate O-acetylesterase n=1 Tax=Salipiger abyssi TaxID=1250539 RepID=UPI004059F70F
MPTPIIILAGQSNASRLSDEIVSALDRTYGAGQYRLVEVYAGGAPLTRDREGNPDWATQGELPDMLLQRSIEALRSTPGGQIVGTIWVQGEGDTFGSSRPGAYAGAFNALFDGFRQGLVAEFGAGVTGAEGAPVVISELSARAPSAGGREYWEAITHAQQQLAAVDPLVVSVDPDDIAQRSGFEQGTMFSDGLHYSDAFSRDLASALIGALDDMHVQDAARDDHFRRDGIATRMAGHTGDDRYDVDHRRDSIAEEAGEGYDLVYSWVSFSLRDHSQHLEALTLRGAADIDATGNGRNNLIIGNSGGNQLNGAWGDDTLIGGAGNDSFRDNAGADRMLGGAGNDAYFVDDHGDQIVELAGEGYDRVFSRVSFELRQHSQHLEALTLQGDADINGIGNGQANTIIGNSGSNFLNGAWGDDTLVAGAGDDTLRDSNGADLLMGGRGNDVYHIDDRGDRIVELAGEGDDLVVALVDTDLRQHSQHLETLTLAGSADISGTGNALDNAIYGNDGNNRLHGAWGNDTLVGGAGNDRLSDSRGNDLFQGGPGQDVFVFYDGFGVDLVTDFEPDRRGEVIDMRAVSAITGFDDLLASHLRSFGGNAVIEDGAGNMIVLQGIEVSDLSANDFLF